MADNDQDLARRIERAKKRAGAYRLVNGKKVPIRRASAASLTPGASAAAKKTRFRPGPTRFLPKNLPGFQHDKEGRVILNTPADRRDAMKRLGLEFSDEVKPL